MPVAIRKLALAEAQRAFPHHGQQDLSEYVDALRGLEPGQAAGIDRQGLSDRAIKRRLGQAAKDLGYRLKWSRQATAEMLYFQVVGIPPAKAADGRRRRRPRAAEPAPPAEPAAPRPRRGRPPRAA